MSQRCPRQLSFFSNVWKKICQKILHAHFLSKKLSKNQMHPIFSFSWFEKSILKRERDWTFTLEIETQKKKLLPLFFAFFFCFLRVQLTKILFLFCFFFICQKHKNKVLKSLELSKVQLFLFVVGGYFINWNGGGWIPSDFIIIMDELVVLFLFDLFSLPFSPPQKFFSSTTNKNNWTCLVLTHHPPPTHHKFPN